MAAASKPLVSIGHLRVAARAFTSFVEHSVQELPADAQPRRDGEVDTGIGCLWCRVKIGSQWGKNEVKVG